MNTAMPDPLDSPASQTLTTTTSFFTPLIISIIGITSTALALLFYHLLLVRYCIRRHAARMSALRTFAGEETPTGVDQKTLATIPIITYKPQSKTSPDQCDQFECAVCLGDFEDGELVRLLPDCKHLFHMKCVDEWFVGHTNCPVCRIPVVAVSIASPDDEIRECPVCRAVGNDLGLEDRTGGEVEVEVEPGIMLRHCNSLVLPGEMKGRLTGMELKRSLSMGQSTCVIIDDNVGRDCGYYYSFRDESIRQLKMVSTKVKQSISRMCVGQEQGSGILPY